MQSLTSLANLPGLTANGGRESLADGVYSALQEAVTNGSLAPGFRLREIALARHYDVSTTPIREALRRLEREGLVVVSPNRGAMVAAFDLREIANLFEVREILERYAIRRAALAIERDFIPIEATLVEAAATLDTPDQIAFNRLDVEFHHRLNTLGGNVPLTELAEQIHRRIQGVRVRCAVDLPGRPTVSHAQHQELVIAVRDRDADRAEALIAGHIQSVCAAVLRVLGAATEGDA